MITQEEYFKALEVINEYLYEHPDFTHCILLGIHDNHHDYSHLIVGREYEITKWYPRRSGFRGRKFIIYIDGKRHMYIDNSSMMSWKFIMK